ncbi:hypothetical protein VTJ83DRAFT_7309 [Remersonia thermophila]|uniref:BSD domain-containing protein n=1 Tax=Remersonia thermophila TaxID=72144 RepID=A0ABR4D458_9PEZI
MDIAYDHIQEQTFPEEHSDSQSGDKKPAPQASLNADLKDAYRAFSNSPWGARIGGFLGTVVKQGESVYREAQQELSAVGQDASQGLSTLRQTVIKHTRNLSLNTVLPVAATPSSSAAESGDAETTPTTTSRNLSSEEALKESETVLSRLKEEAAKRLRDLQRAEDAADEALLRFGTNLRDFLQDAITIKPPTEDAQGQGGGNAVLFESKDAHGKRVIHTSRFDAQLHLVHTSTDSFTKDGQGPEFESWVKEFDIDKKTEDISSDLEKYPELRATMEKLVPDQVPYADFWKRYYFVRHGIETAEARRRDLLKAASAEEEVGWDEDSSEEEEESSSDEEEARPDAAKPPARPGSAASSKTIQPPPTDPARSKPAEPRKSNDEKSVADSDASYDVVGAASGVASRAPNSPKDSRKADDDDDDDDEDSSDEEEESDSDWE